MAMDGFHRARFCCSATRGRDDDRRRWARDTNHKMKVTRDEIFSPIAIFQGDDMILKRSYKKLFDYYLITEGILYIFIYFSSIWEKDFSEQDRCYRFDVGARPFPVSFLLFSSSSTTRCFVGGTLCS